MKFLQVIYENFDCDYHMDFLFVISMNKYDLLYDDKNLSSWKDRIYLFKSWIKNPVLNYSQRFHK